MNVLEQIVAERRAAVQESRRRLPEPVLLEAIPKRRKRYALASRLGPLGAGVIAEVKKASPSAGILRSRYDPAATAKLYECGGAAGISVLTEPCHFLGCGADLSAVRCAVSLPVLRKDFVFDSYQLAEAALWGADVVLLIVAALDEGVLRELYFRALALGLDVLVESHTERELECALSLDKALIGVNSRDLQTLKTDLGTAFRLACQIPEERLAIAESGIRTHDDILLLREHGYRGFLVGESVLRAECPEEAVARLTGVSV